MVENPAGQAARTSADKGILVTHIVCFGVSSNGQLVCCLQHSH